MPLYLSSHTDLNSPVHGFQAQEGEHDLVEASTTVLTLLPSVNLPLPSPLPTPKHFFCPHPILPHLRHCSVLGFPWLKGTALHHCSNESWVVRSVEGSNYAPHNKHHYSHHRGTSGDNIETSARHRNRRGNQPCQHITGGPV